MVLLLAFRSSKASATRPTCMAQQTDFEYEIVFVTCLRVGARPSVGNACWKELQFQIQEGAPQGWLTIVDTSLPSPEDFSELGRHLTKLMYEVAPRTIVILVRAEELSSRQRAAPVAKSHCRSERCCSTAQQISS